MAAIRALLNPSSISVHHDDRADDQPHRQLLPVPHSINRKPPPRLLSPINSIFSQAALSPSPSPALSPRKRPKICKDQPVFTRGPVRGPVRYAPFEYDSKTLSAYQQQFDMFPMEDLGAYPRHIPYNSEKKLFLEKTGRDFFEVFQYQFKVPGMEQSYTLLWDYNIGLVRTTPLFKCCGYGKTTPAKMLNRNVGLRDICHSITGGSLVAQGYWIPYEAAKAIAATFCWSIRYVLTPVFGIDFIDMCIPPDSDKFGQMLIDQNVTQFCTEQARKYRQLELENPSTRPTSAIPSPRTPITPDLSKPMQQMRFKAINDTPTSSGYSSEASEVDQYTLSPGSPGSPVPFRHPWSAANTPRSFPVLDEELLSPKSLVTRVKAKRAAEKAFGHEELYSSVTSTSVHSPKLRKFDHKMDVDEDYDGDAEGVGNFRYHGGREGPDDTAAEKREDSFGEKEAARALMSLWGVKKIAKRRASA